MNKFTFLVGNPPYQDETLGDNKGFSPPIYNLFIDSAYKVANKVELIHPARFLFDAGSTPKAWNQKMLSDEHLTVLEYIEDASKVFINTDIKGGVAITYHDTDKNFGAIGIFTSYPEVNRILAKTALSPNKHHIDEIGVSGYSYHFTKLVHEEHPEFLKAKIIVKGKEQPLISKGHELDLKSNIIDKLPSIFFDTMPQDGHDYIVIVGRKDNERVFKYIRRDYVNTVTNLDKYKLLLPKASGIGTFGEAIGPGIYAEPGMGHTETFFSIGRFNSEIEVKNLHKYLKSKFARCLLSVTKKTQNITPGNFQYVPLQNFTDKSDIDWSKSIHDIDLQLYKKYGLSADEIEFIESHVKEMT